MVSAIFSCSSCSCFCFFFLIVAVVFETFVLVVCVSNPIWKIVLLTFVSWKKEKNDFGTNVVWKTKRNIMLYSILRPRHIAQMPLPPDKNDFFLMGFVVGFILGYNWKEKNPFFHPKIKNA